MSFVLNTVVLTLAVRCVAAFPIRPEGSPAQLWRLPGYQEDVYPAPASIAAFASLLSQRGFAVDDDTDDALSVHVPYARNSTHEASHVGVGYVAIDYEVIMHEHAVHMDEFLALFIERNATWECSDSVSLPPPFEDSVSTTTTLSFAPPASESDPAAALHVLTYLTNRLLAPNATLTWGPLLLAHSEGSHVYAPVFAPSCDVPLRNRYSEPYFLVGNVSTWTAPDGTVSINVTLQSTISLMLFKRVRRAHA